MKIDLHTHILPENWPNLREKYGYGGFASIEHCGECRARLVIDGKHFRDIESNCWDPLRRIAECDAAAVTRQVLSTVPVMFNYQARPEDTHDLSRFLNDHLAGVVDAHPSRFHGLGTLPMQSPALAIRELERCVRELGLCGVEIGTNINGKNLDDPGVFEVLEAAASLDAAVFVHPWDMLGRERMPRYFLPWLVGMPAEESLAICSVIFGGVLERLPGLRICFAHGGGAFPGTLGRIEHGFHARPDLCAVNIQRPPSAYLGRFYVDALVHDAEALRQIVRLFGVNRVAMGSDYPFPLGEHPPGHLIESMPDLDDPVREQLLWKTALDFLRPRTAETTAPAVAPGQAHHPA
ncbi:MAG: hypothetical protein GMKNLPBB_02253 [Myxococcota bacterium]|nr:hypothetical protein [Myxococcota bacterium]